MSEKRPLPLAHGDAQAAATHALADGMAQAHQSRRTFMGTLAGAAATASAATTGCDGGIWETYFQQHYLRLSDQDKRDLIARIEQKAREERGVDVFVSDDAAPEGVEWGYALSLSACTGCRQCEYACAEENNTSRDPEMHYIRVLEIDQGTLEVEGSEHRYEGTVPKPGKFYMPVQCHQCADPPCVKACPVHATWTEKDGIVVVDYDWCIGCRYCMAACPYDARHFNYAEPDVPPSEINPEQGLLSNRIRPKGVVEKCHFCLHRVRKGLQPACLEVCPVGARVFGNLLDPNSAIRRVLDEKRIYVFKEALGTLPRFFYFFD